MRGNRFFKKTISIISMGVALSLYGCGGSSSSDDDTSPSTGGPEPIVNTGVFIDAPVKGLQYSTATQSGVTNEYGEFTYRAGEEVVFKIDGLEIGTVTGAPQVPVTQLPQYVEVARLLQSLDTDALEELIDISEIKISASLKNQLQNLLENKQGDFDTVLTQSQLNAIASDSQVQLVNAAPVTEQAAVQHMMGFISEGLSESDFNRQTYVEIDSGVILSFEDDGTGFEFIVGDGAPSKSPFTWSITNNKLGINHTDGESVNVGFLSVDANKYVVSVSEQEGTFVTTINKAKPLTISVLDGKILALDVSGDSDCSARSIKITGTTGFVKEQCTGGYFEEIVTLSNAINLDNAIYIQGSNTEDGNFFTQIHLVEGSIADGKYIFIDEPQNTAPNDIFFYRMYETDTEVEEGQTDTLSSLIIGKTLYQHVKDENGHTGISTLEFKSNGELVVNDFGHIEAENYRISENIIYTTDSDSQEEHAHPLIEQSEKYLKFQDSDGTSTFYFVKSDAQAATVEDIGDVSTELETLVIGKTFYVTNETETEITAVTFNNNGSGTYGTEPFDYTFNGNSLTITGLGKSDTFSNHVKLIDHIQFTDGSGSETGRFFFTYEAAEATLK